MTARRAIAVVLVAGVGTGAATAQLVAGESPRAVAAPIAGATRTAPQRVPIAPVGPVTISARTVDLGGAAPWAVRRLTTRSRGQTYPCLQLGRIDGRRFGWITPGQPFRLARFDQADVPTICGAQFLRGLPHLSVVTLTTDATSGLPQPDRTIVWGVLPPGVASARLRDGTRLDAGTDRVVLAVLPPRPVGEPRLAGTLHTTAGTSRPFAYPVFDRVAATRGSSLRNAGTALPGRIRIAARVPDPAGGAAWGILTAPSSRGGVCFSSPGRIVGQRLAVVEPHLGIARPTPFDQELDCSNRRAPTTAHPLRMDVLLSSIPDADPVGTRQLRRLNDRTVLHGRTTPDVREVTITTSRDIRTVLPDPKTHVVIAVYDGTFPGEHFKATATMRDGSHRTVLQTTGG
ncbi:MAG: hypothetical protein LC798_01755 [Chloroflexi bacterium]|nr:hypothetical protein [Chloroflexota bacterium]